MKENFCREWKAAYESSFASPCIRTIGASEAEVIATVQEGERFVAKFGRTGFRRNFAFDGEWHGHGYSTKQIEAYCVEEDGWLVITVIVKYF